MKQAEWTPTARGIALSLGVHLLLALWIWRQVPPAPRPAPKPDPTQIEFNTVTKAPPKPVAPPIPLPPQPLPLPPVAKVKTPAPPQPTAQVVPPTPVPPTPANPDATGTSPDALGVPLANEASKDKASGIAVPDFKAAGTHSVFELVQRLPQPDAGEQVTDRGLRAPDYDPDQNHRLVAMIDAKRGQRAVERGMIDPYFGQLSKVLSSRWTLAADSSDPVNRNLMQTVVANFKSGLTGYMQQAAAYGASGKLGVGERTSGGADDLPQAALEMQARQEAFTHHGEVHVRLTQGRDGHLVRVELVRPSDDPDLDQAVLRDLRSGDVVLPVPPTEGMGIRDPIKSIWAFKLSIMVCPPAPMIGGGFNIDALYDKKSEQGLFDVCVPLDKKVTKHVELLSVD